MPNKYSKEETEVIEKWNEIKNKAMKDEPSTFLEFCQCFMEHSNEELDDYFHWDKHITEPLLKSVESVKF